MIRTLALAAILVPACCGKKDNPPPSDGVEGGSSSSPSTGDGDPSPAGDGPQPSTTQAAMYRAFALRDHAPACADVEALGTEPVADLLWLADNAPMPPWVGMRAANCLVTRHGAEVPDTLLSWVSDPAAKGFGLLVLDELEHLPEDLAVEVARKAVAEGPDPDAARERILKDPRPAVRAVAG